MDESEIRAISRPHRNLLTLYLLQSLATLFAFPFVFLPLYFKYHTLRYDFGDDGISASWGMLFKREIHLTYRRIQDIHVSRNLIERWLGIGKVEIQTASGKAAAELTIEGMEQWDPIRDFLYGKMRGTGAGAASRAPSAGSPASDPRGAEAEAVALLRGIKDDVEGIRRALEAGGVED